MREGIGIEGSADVVASALLQVLFDQGWDTGQQPVRLRAMLSDLLGSSAADHEAAVDALVVGAELGAAAVASSPSEGASDAVTVRLTEWGLSAETATWVTATWSWAYRQLILDTPTAEFTDETILPDAASGAETELPAQDRLAELSMPFVVTAPRSEQPPTMTASEIPAVMLGIGVGATKTTEDEITEGVAEPLGVTAASGTPYLTPRRILIGSAAAVVLIGGLVGTAFATGGPTPSHASTGSPDHRVKIAAATTHTTTTTSQPSNSSTTTTSTTSSSTSASSGQANPSGKAAPASNSPAHTPASSTKAPSASGSSTPPAPSPSSSASAAPPPSTTTTTTTTAPPPPPAPVASNWSITYTPSYGQTPGYFDTVEETVGQISPEVSGSWTSLVIVNPGNRTYVDLVDTSGSNYIEWRPNQNGASWFQVYYYVVNAQGERSNQATLTVNVNCNPTTQCNAPAPPP